MSFLRYSVPLFLLLSALSCSVETSELSCTSSCVSDGDSVYLAKSYEWGVEEGAAIFLPSGLRKKAVFLKRAAKNNSYMGAPGILNYFDKKGAEWTSHYASIVYSQAGSLFPMSGINEKGLVVESLTNNISTVSSFEEANHAVNELQWVSYQLDNYTSTDEVIANMKSLEIQLDAVKLHYMVCDVSAECAVIEFDQHGKLLTTKLEGKYPKVISNHLAPTSLKYEELFAKEELPSMENASTKSGAASSLGRYRIAKTGLEDLNQPETSVTISTITEKLLDPVWIEGFTQWNLIHELDKFRTMFRTASSRDFFFQIDGAALGDDLGCDKVQRKYLDMLKVNAPNGTLPGSVVEVTGALQDLTIESELKLVKVGIDKVIRPKLIEYYEGNEDNATNMANYLTETFVKNSIGSEGFTCEK